jgi:hypothetical protein
VSTALTRTRVRDVAEQCLQGGKIEVLLEDLAVGLEDDGEGGVARHDSEEALRPAAL